MPASISIWPWCAAAAAWLCHAARSPSIVTPLRIRGAVGPSLYRSARAAGAPVKAIQQYLAAIDAQISLDGDISPSDQFDFIVAYKRSASGESETGELLFAGLERGGRPLAQLVRWGSANDSGGQFYDASGSSNSERNEPERAVCSLRSMAA